MGSMTFQFNTAIDLRIELALNSVFRRNGLVPDVDEQYIEQEAHILGCVYPFSEGIRRLFEGTSLEAAYVFGDNEAEALRAEIEDSTGSQDEWDALSAEEQDQEWGNFHDLCAQGIADTMYFYRVMMNMHLENYVGH